MDGYQRRMLLVVAVGLFALSGANCPHFVQYTSPLPRVLPPSATVEQVIQAVNQNNGQIQSYSTTTATISGPGWPTLRASIAFQRPRLFRLRAETGLTGPEVDLGSNEQIFWFWVRRNQPPGVYFCRHEQFATSRAADDSRRTRLAHRCAGPQPFRSGPAASGPLSDGRRSNADPHHPRDGRRADDQDHGGRRRPGAGAGATDLRRPGPPAGQQRGRRASPGPAHQFDHARHDPRQFPARAVLDAHRPGQRAGQPAGRQSGRALGDAELPRAPAVDLGDPNVQLGPATAASCRAW